MRFLLSVVLITFLVFFFGCKTAIEENPTVSSFPSPSIEEPKEKVGEDKPKTIIVPTGSLGEITETRIQILEKTLESKLDDYFAIVPKELFEEAQEKAFEELDYDECTEEQCIMMIQELLQVENAFQLVLISEEGNTQISITWSNLDQRRVEENYCEGCKTKELRESIVNMIENILGVMEVKTIESNKGKNKYKFHGTKCYFRLLRPKGGYPGNPVVNQIAKGRLEIIKNKVQLKGNWFMKGNSSPESLSEAQIFINDDGSLEGVMEVYNMYTPEGDTPFEPVLVDISETEGKLIIGNRKASYKFPMGKMIGRLDFLSCSKN